MPHLFVFGLPLRCRALCHVSIDGPCFAAAPENIDELF